MSIELEWKYQATEKTLLEIERAFPGAYRSITMATTYFDTPDYAFSRRRWTLRHRLENGVGVCTLKMPSPGDGRLEYEAPAADLSSGVAALAAQGVPEELAQLARQAKPRCGAAFTRRALTLRLPGAVVELALDQGTLSGGGKELPFAEVEVERKQGQGEVAEAFAQRLAEQFDLKSEPLSKFARAAELAGGV